MTGTLFAFTAQRLLEQRKPNPFGPSCWAAVGFALWFWGLVTWFVVFAPDWMLCYLVPSANLPLAWVHALFGVSLVLASFSGHTLTATLLQSQHRWAAMMVLGAGLIVWFGLWSLTLDRYLVVGSFYNWRTSAAAPIGESHLTVALNTVGVLQAFALVLGLVIVHRLGTRPTPNGSVPTVPTGEPNPESEAQKIGEAQQAR